jgi:hypothetical protein
MQNSGRLLVCFIRGNIFEGGFFGSDTMSNVSYGPLTSSLRAKSDRTIIGNMVGDMNKLKDA